MGGAWVLLPDFQGKGDLESVAVFSVSAPFLGVFFSPGLPLRLCLLGGFPATASPGKMERLLGQARSWGEVGQCHPFTPTE